MSQPTTILTDPLTRPAAAGAYVDWQQRPSADPATGRGGTVAVPATGTWGPINTPVPLASLSDAYAVFGKDDTPLLRAIKDAFLGYGWGGYGGAGTVVAIRQAVNTAAKASWTLQNTTPANALTLTARYPGTRANALRVTVQVATAGGKELLITENGNVVERFALPATDVTALAAEITAKSKWVTATSTITGVTLNNVSAIAPTVAGTDGATLTGTEWTTTMAQLDRVDWDVLAPYGLTDSTIRASLRAWRLDRVSRGLQGVIFVGGGAAESLATAQSRSTALNDPGFVNLGAADLVRTDEGNRAVTTSELVARVAGVRAWNGETNADLFVRLAGVEITATNGASATDEAAAITTGVVVFSRDTHAEAPVFIREAVTTYVDDTASPIDARGVKTKPVAIYKDPRLVAIQQGVDKEVAFGARNGGMLGKVTNTDKGREQLLSLVRSALEKREAAGIIKPNWQAWDLTPNDEVDYALYAFSFDDTKTLRQMFCVGQIG